MFGAAHQGREDAVLAASLFAINPAGLAWQMRSPAGPARDALLAMLRSLLPPDAPVRRCPLGIGDERLLGGLDLASTLACGRRVAQRGLLAESDGGVLVLPMAERLTPEAAARLCPVLDHGELLVERDGVTSRDAAKVGMLLLDEGVEQEQPPAALVERSAFRTTLDGLAISDLPPQDLARQDLARRVEAARSILPRVRSDARIVEALCGTAQALGIGSLRAPMMALRIAHAAAALDGRTMVTEQDAALAARLVLAWRATRLPVEAEPDQQEDEAGRMQEPREQPAGDVADAGQDVREPAPEQVSEQMPEQMPEQIIEAVLASLPPDLLGRLQAQAAGPAADGGGRVAAGQVVASLHGRPLFTRAGRPERGRRLALVDTLRTAAPWQALRRQARAQSGLAGRRVEVRAGDFRIVQCEQRPRNIAIFVVDASGSAATGRLADAKGAIEQLLGDCYVRRDRVALIAFRGTGAELLLPPTGALTRARRSLAGLPGGGGTPLATGLEAAMALALSQRARGETPLIVLLTDGRANITRAGIADRVRAGEEAGMCASRLRQARLSSLLVDISPRPEAKAEALAARMGALYLKLPDAAGLSRAVREAAA